MLEKFKIWIAPLFVLGNEFVRFLPKFFSSILIIIVGFILAWVIQLIIKKICQLLRIDQKLSHIWLFKIWKSNFHGKSPSAIISVFFYYTTLFITILLVIKIVGTNSNQAVINSLISLIPRIISFVLVLFLGILLAMLLSVILQLIIARTGNKHSHIFGKFIAWSILGFAIIFSIEQLGIIGIFFKTLLIIIFSAIGLGAAIAFGIGCKDIAREFIIEYLKNLKNTEKEE